MGGYSIDATWPFVEGGADESAHHLKLKGLAVYWLIQRGFQADDIVEEYPVPKPALYGYAKGGIPCNPTRFLPTQPTTRAAKPAPLARTLTRVRTVVGTSPSDSSASSGGRAPRRRETPGGS